MKKSPNKQNNSCFKILHKDRKTKARVGEIKTKSGDIETPFFMPVATKGSVKHINSRDLEEMNCKAVISNTFVLHLRPGEQTIKKLGGIKKFMNFKGINVTDSGGFQMYTPSLFIKSEDKGVHFKNPYTNEKVFITPEKDMQIQFDLGSDIGMCLDSMPLYTNSKKEIEKSVELTTLWAERCKKHHDWLNKNIRGDKRQLLFGITQGGIHSDLRKKSAESLKKLNFDGYSIGGIALPEFCYKGDFKKAQIKERGIINIVRSLIPENKVLYLMGQGDPIELLEAVSRGVDMFDSRFPTQNARHGTILTSKGKLRILRSKYKLDKKPLDENCSCWVCKNYTRAYIRYQLESEEAVGMRLATFHNLYYLMDLMKSCRQAIKTGKFLEFKNKVKKIYAKEEKSVKRNN